MAKFKGAILNCTVCGAEFKVPPSRAATAKACSHECAKRVRGESGRRRVTLRCANCGDDFDVPQSHADRRKYCSERCKHSAPEYRSAISDRYTGPSNPSWKGGVVEHPDGYLYELAPGHPFASNGYVLQHRLVMERWLLEHKPGSKFLLRVFDRYYLSPSYEVHHRDRNKRNNEIANLQCLTHAQHQRVHAEMRRKARGAG